MISGFGTASLATFYNIDSLSGRNIFQALDLPARPADFEFVDQRCLAQSDDLSSFIRGVITVSTTDFLDPSFCTDFDFQDGANRIAI